MKRYIRTEHNIWEVVDENDSVFRVKSKSDSSNIYSKSKCQTTVVKSADTIEELCDEFVVLDNNGKPQVYSPFNLKVWTTDNDLYGAIWTDKGLIYVAKMNEKGELELL